MKKIFTWLIFCSCILIYACDFDQLAEPVVLELCVNETFTYNNQIKTIIDRTCSYSGCHDSSGGAPGDFTTYETMGNFLNENKFEERVIVLRNMPDVNDVLPEKLLTDDEYDMLTCWVNQGYLEN